MITCERSNTFSPSLELLPDAAVSAPLPLFDSSLPFRDRNFLCPVATPEPRKTVLKHPCRMAE